MPWRLLVLIIILAVLLAFITFNLENRCDVSFGVKVYKDIPIFLTIFTSFILGMLCALPIKINAGKKRGGAAKDKKPPIDNFSDSDDVPYINNIEPDEKIKQDAMSARERFFAKRRDGK